MPRSIVTQPHRKAAPAKGAQPIASPEDRMLLKLKESCLDAADAAALNFKPYSDAESAELHLSRKGAGFLIPYFSYNGKPAEMFRYRYFETKQRNHWTGTDEEQRKYDQPGRSKPEIYLPHLNNVDWPKILADKSVSIAIVEGELKAACVTKHVMPCVGLGGVWNYASKKLNVKFLQSLEHFHWKGREVDIIFDSDIATNDQVFLAAKRLARLLKERDAKVRIVILPHGKSKVGADDYVFQHGPDKLKELIAETVWWDNDGGRNDLLFRRGRWLRSHGEEQAAIESKLLELNMKECKPPLPDDAVREIVEDVMEYPVSQAVQAIRDGERPVVMLPSDDRLMSECAADLGLYMADALYLFNGEVVSLDNGTPRLITPQLFRTMVEDFAVCARQRVTQKLSVTVHVTMNVEEARGILASDHFRSKLRPLKRIGRCRLPVLRSDGAIELLPEGYDYETATMTVSDVEYDDDMTFKEAVAVIRDLFSEFEFADGERSLSVAVTTLMSLYAAQLVDVRGLRPIFAMTKNAAGAGATLLCACAIVPVIGSMVTGVKPATDEEMGKVLVATLRSGSTVMMLDNVKGHLDFPKLEAFVTSYIYSDRMLGTNEMYKGENHITVFVTGNGMTMTEDMRRRTLFVELHLSAERPEDRPFRRKLDVPTLVSMRPQILAACWAVVRHWNEQGRPTASRTHSFPTWDKVMGGIVESAGFGCPFAPAAVAAVADSDGDSMRTLAAAMKPGTKYDAHRLAELCRVQGAFNNLVGDTVESMTRSHSSAFGWALSRWNSRQVADRVFFVEGKGHAKRFRVELRSSVEKGDVHGCTVLHGFKTEEQNSQKVLLGPETMQDHVPCSPPPEPPSAHRHMKFTREGRKKWAEKLKNYASAAATSTARKPKH